MPLYTSSSVDMDSVQSCLMKEMSFVHDAALRSVRKVISGSPSAFSFPHILPSALNMV